MPDLVLRPRLNRIASRSHRIQDLALPLLGEAESIRVRAQRNVRGRRYADRGVSSFIQGLCGTWTSSRRIPEARMGTATDSWLALIIEQAVANDWCTKTICATCGAHDFRRAAWTEAAVQIGRSYCSGGSGRTGSFSSYRMANDRRSSTPSSPGWSDILVISAAIRPCARCLTTSDTPFRSDWSNRHWSGRKPVKYSGASDSTRPMRPFVDGHTK